MHVLCVCVYAQKVVMMRLHKKRGEAIGAELKWSFYAAWAILWQLNILLCEQISNVWFSGLAKLVGNSRFLFIPEREDELHGGLGNSQNQWERDTNVALSCPPVATAVTALWHSHCSVICCCFDSKVWKYPVSAGILGVAKILPGRLSQLRKWWFFFFQLFVSQ